MSTKIEWTDETWNPVRGCTIVSEGCKNCYAMKFAHRFSGEGKPYEGLTRQTSTGPKWTGHARAIYTELRKPLSWKSPRRIFVCSMSDLFHDDVPDHFILLVFSIMAIAKQHTFQILTKRPERAVKWFGHIDPSWADPGMQIVSERARFHAWHDFGVNIEFSTYQWPLPNVWIGTSIEDQKTANERIPHLLEIPAAVRFLSCEPLVGEIDLKFWRFPDPFIDNYPDDYGCGAPLHIITKRGQNIHWVIAGGESGPGARPMHPDWVRSLRDQCQEAEVPFFFKQWGEWLPNGQNPADEYYDREDHFSGDPWDYFPDLDAFDKAQKRHDKKMERIRRVENGMQFYKYGKKYTGNFLDGKQHLEFPEIKKEVANV